MREWYFDLGGMIVRVLAREEDLDPTQGHLARFQVEPQAWDAQLQLEFAHSLPQPQGDCLYASPERQVFDWDGDFLTYVGQSPDWAYLRLERRGNTTKVLAKRSAFPGPIQSKTLLTAIEAEHLVVWGQGILLHASLVEFEGRAIVFTAPSGTGKSTQAELWRSLRGARILNGDRAVLAREGEGFEARGIPFCGTSGICQPAKLPLAAIVCLSQSPRTTIRPLTGVRAFRSIWEGCSLQTWNRQEVDLCARTVSDLVRQVPVYHLACTPDTSAVEALESELRKGRT